MNSTLKYELKLNKDINLYNFIEGLFEKNLYKINKNINEYLLKFSSYQLFCKNGINENFYQVLLMQMFIFWKNEGLTAEENSGNGRYDFGFPNKYNNKKKEYILIEVKKILQNKKMNKNISLYEECKNAIKKIERKKYEERHKNNGYSSILKYGIAFYENNCKVLLKIDKGEIIGYSDNKNNYNNDNDDNNN